MPSVVALASACVCVSRALAHDQWLEPEVRSADSGTTAAVRLYVGEAPFADEEKAFEPTKFARLALVSRNGTVDLAPRAVSGARPLVSVARLGDGEFLFVADRTPVLIDLPPTKFESYLADEGLSHVTRDRAVRGEREKIGRERYTRYTKALAEVGTPGSRGMARAVIGQRLEIVLATAPPLQKGNETVVGITFEGRPLVGARVHAAIRPNEVGSARALGDAGHAPERASLTDTGGRARFVLDSPGLLVIHLVHMRRCEDAAKVPCRDADWESFWGSFAATVH